MLTTSRNLSAKEWPSRLWIIRHGQSAGNVARDAAQLGGLDRIVLHGRDVDVPLSPLGEEQADALGRWFANMPPEEQPEVLLASPYLRAVRTAEIMQASGRLNPEIPVCHDERLREKEFGILDGLTTPGVARAFPEQAEFRQLLGKFYHRPPGGESWCDVILRLRSVLDMTSLHHAGQRVAIVAHQVVVLCMRYIIENLDEAAILAIDREADVANCAVTEYRSDPATNAGKLALYRYNYTVPVEQQDVPVTREKDPPIAARG
ncbi:MAG: histidine phosphatase family protein [Novosphingobium sp.]